METTSVYVDYLCPFAWRGAELAKLLGGKSSFRLRLFSLESGNHPDNAKDRHQLNWKLWEQPLEGSRSLPQFLAGLSARRQGEEAFWNYSLELFRLRHAEKADFSEQTLALAAQRAGLDIARWESDRRDQQGLRAELKAELEDAAQIAVFGTPTFQLPGGDAAYFRFTGDPRTMAESEREALWKVYAAVLASGAHIETVKRPR
jgi:predicted DsbA family dithiol-disulfide isomerase